MIRRKPITDINNIKLTKTRNSTVEKSKNQSESEINKKNIIFSSIDTIYSTINKKQHYFKYISFKVLLLICIIFTNSLLFIYQIYQPIYTIYCWNSRIYEFIKCQPENECESIDKFIRVYYISPSDYSNSNLHSNGLFNNDIVNEEELIQLSIINNRLSKFFKEDNLIFNFFNSKKLSLNIETTSKYSVKLILNKNNSWNINFLLYVSCKKYNIILVFLLLIGIFLLIFYLFFSFISDIYGRKVVMVTILIVNIIGYFLVFSFLFLISNTNIDSTYINDVTLSNYDSIAYVFKESLYNHKEFLDFLKFDYFHYRKRLTINTYFYLYYIGISFIFTGNTLIPTAFAYIIEYSLNEIIGKKNIFRFCLCFPVSIILSLLIISIDFDIKYFYLSMGCLMVLVCLYIVINFHESPRFVYEMFDFIGLTELIHRIIKKKKSKKLRKYYINIENISIKDVKNQITRQSTMKSSQIGNFLCCYSLRQKINHIETIIKKGKNINFTRNDFKSQPFLLIIIFIKDSFRKRRFKLVVVLNFVNSFIFFLSILNIYSIDFYTREDFFREIVVFHKSFLIPISIIIGLYVFSFINSIFGNKFILFLCYCGVFITSLVYGLLNLEIPSYKDMDLEYFGSGSKRNYEWIVLLMLFFSSGLFYILYMRIVLYSKTLYRSISFTFHSIIVAFSMIITLGVYVYFERNVLYVTVFSIIGLINNYFLKEENFYLISDFAKLEVN